MIDAADMVEAGRGRSRDRVARALVERLDRDDAKANVAQEIRPHHNRRDGVRPARHLQIPATTRW